MRCPECGQEMEQGRLFLRSAYAARVYFFKKELEESLLKKWADLMFDRKRVDAPEVLSTDKGGNNTPAFTCTGCGTVAFHPAANNQAINGPGSGQP